MTDTKTPVLNLPYRLGLKTMWGTHSLNAIYDSRMKPEVSISSLGLRRPLDLGKSLSLA